MTRTRWLSLLSPDRYWRRYALLLVLLFVARGAMLLSVLPPFEAWDEYQHVAYVSRMAHRGSTPLVLQSAVPASLLNRVVQFPIGPHPTELAAHGARSYAAFWNASSPIRLSAPDDPVLLYEAQQPSFYYRLMTPLFRLAGGDADLRQTVAVLRVANLLLGTAALWLILRGLEGFVKNRAAAATAALWLALQPLFLMNIVRVANDPLALFLGTASVLGLLSLDQMPRATLPRTLSAAALGAVIGLAIVAKPINLALLPLAVFGLCLVGLRGKLPWRMATLAGLTMLGAALLICGPMFWWNLRTYGLLSPMGEAVVNRRNGHHLLDLLRWAQPGVWWNTYCRWWGRESLWCGGWSLLRVDRPLETLYWYWIVVAMAFAAIATVRGMVSKRSKWQRPRGDGPLLLQAVVLCVVVTAAMTFHGLQTRLMYNGAILTPPWYAALAQPWFILIGAVGVEEIVRLTGFTGCRCVAPIICLVAETRGIFWRMLPVYGATSSRLLALYRLAQLQPAWLGSLTMVVSAVIAGACAAAALAALARLRLGDSPRPVARH